MKMDDKVFDTFKVIEILKHDMGTYTSLFDDSIYSEKETKEPTVVVAEEKKGTWMGAVSDGLINGNPHYISWECSRCAGEVYGTNVPSIMRYCPFCGGKML